MSFETIKLTNHRVVVKGTDSYGSTGETVLNSEQWDSINRRTAHDEAVDKFNEAVSEFFAPLTDAIEAAEAATQGEDTDPVSYVVLNEGTVATAGEQREVVNLTRDSIVLRLIEEGQEDRLVWVNNELEVLAVLPGTSVQGGTPSVEDVDLPEPHEG